MLALSLTVIASFSAGASAEGSSGSSQVFVYYNSTGYHFMGFAWNQFGQPLSGARFDAGVTVPSLSPNIATGSGVSNSSRWRYPTIMATV
ncbi:MAG: hypothetical protein OK456_07980 [Thaumarchaeota archaeon]|nr:hypothetical protein [Nitrososphaerota archaeon]